VAAPRYDFAVFQKRECLQPAPISWGGNIVIKIALHFKRSKIIIIIIIIIADLCIFEPEINNLTQESS
jgi:hypothetical protein